MWVIGTLQWLGNEGPFFHSRNSHTIWVIEVFWFCSITWLRLRAKARQVSDTPWEGKIFSFIFGDQMFCPEEHLQRVHGWAHVLSSILAFVGRKKPLLLSCFTESLHSGMGCWAEWCCCVHFSFIVLTSSVALWYFEEVFDLKAERLWRVPTIRPRSLSVLYSCAEFFFSTFSLWADKLAEEIFWSLIKCRL